MIERVVNALGEGKGGEGLDLDGGKLVDVPKEFGQLSAQQQSKWAANNKVDLVVDFAPSLPLSDMSGGAMGGGMMRRNGRDNSPERWALVPEGLKLGVIQERWDWATKKHLPAWDHATGEELRSALASPTPGTVEGWQPTAIVSERRGIAYYEIPLLPAA